MSDASVVVKLQDQFTPQARSMASASTAFNKTLEQAQAQAAAYSQRLSAIIEQESKLQTAMDGAKQELNAAKKAFAANADEANSDKLQQAYQKYNTLKSELKSADAAAKDTSKSMRNLNEESRKGGLGNSLAAAGYTKLLTGAATNLAGTLISSATTSETGDMVSSIFSGASEGAAIGALVGQPVVGAMIGGAAGIANGVSEVFKSQDQSFKGYVSNLYSELQDQMTQELQAGIQIAGQRETIKLSYNTLLGKESDSILKQIKSFADKTPYTYAALTTTGRSLASYGYDDEKSMMYAMKGIASAASAVGLSNDDITTVADVIGRMNSGEMSAMQLRRLTFAGLNPYTMMQSEYNSQNGTNKSVSDIRKMVTDGKISAQWAAQALLDYYTKNFGSALETFSQTFEGLTSTVGDWKMNMQNSMGESYNSSRKKGLQEQLGWYQGEGGTELSKAYSAIGEAQAYSANYKDELKQASLSWALTGKSSNLIKDKSSQDKLGGLFEEYQQAQEQYQSADGEQRAEAGAKMDTIVKQAEALATGLYDSSSWAQVQAEQEMDLTGAIQQLTSTIGAWKPGYEVTETQSKGLASTFTSGTMSGGTGGGLGGGIGGNYAKHAYGLARVPYDDYPALLHQGERVLTASEARSSGGMPPLTITGNHFTVREEADIDKIASALARKVAAACALS